MNAREWLDQVQQRADLSSHYQGVAGDLARTDVPRLVAALRAVLNLADGIDAREDLWPAEQETLDGEAILVDAVPVHELRAAITDHLNGDPR